MNRLSLLMIALPKTAAAACNVEADGVGRGVETL